MKNKKVKSQSGRVFGTMTGPMENYKPQHTPTPIEVLKRVDEFLTEEGPLHGSALYDDETTFRTMVKRAVNAYEKDQATINELYRAVEGLLTLKDREDVWKEYKEEILFAEKVLAKAESK